jgi:small multidrug resistance family-3 protein
MFELKTLALFVATAVAEIVGCYLPYLWLKKDASVWLLVPAAASLAVFVWLLTLHPTAAGRVYAVDAMRPSPYDWLGVAVCLVSMGIIMFSPRPA